MSKSILISIILSFLAVTYVAAQDAFTPFEGTQKTYQVNNHIGSTYNWAVYKQVGPLVAASPAATTITGNGSSQITVLWNQAGDYYLLVTETDASGCTNTKAMRITVLPNNFRVLFTNKTSSSCYQANNDFILPIQFKDGTSGLPVGATHFPMVVSFTLNGVSQPTQTILFANQTLVVSGSTFTAISGADTPVTLTVTGATDALNLIIQPETVSGQNIHTRTIFRILTAPTVVSQATTNTTPTITGTVTVGANESLTVSVNGFTYTEGDGNLGLPDKNNWVLTIPSSRALPEGIYPVTATVTNTACSLSDATTNELTIDITPPAVPTVIRQTTNDNTPVIAGTAVLASGEKLTVTVNGVSYAAGDGKLVLTGTSWTLQIPAGSQLPDGTYNVVATVTDAAGNSSTDITTNELTIDTIAPAVPTVISQVTGDTTPVISGTATLGNGETLKVTVNGLTYTAGDGKLSLTGTSWSLQIPAGSEILNGTYPVTATVTDAAGNSSSDLTTNELIVNTNVAVSNRLATNDVNITFSNTPASGNVLINDAGFFGFNPTVTIYSLPVNGTVSISSDGQYTYTPKKDFTGVDNFYYIVCTAQPIASCDTANVNIHILPDVLAQIPPIANNDETQTLRNTPVSGNVLVNDLSVSGEKISVDIKPKGGPKSGTLVLNPGGGFVYTPKAGFIGSDYFVYQIYGEISGLTAQARATITVSPNPAEVGLFAADDVFFSFGKEVKGNLLANDRYQSASTLTVTQSPLVQVAHGTVKVNVNGTFSYIPAAGFVGTDQFVYEICDASLNECDKATVYIMVKETPALFADLAIVKTGPATAIPGEPVSYKITLTNLGTAAASKIQISDYMTAAIENPKYNLSGSTSLTDWTGYYNLASLDVNQTFSLNISGNVAVNAPDTLKNVATVTSLTWDPNPVNNISVVNTLVRRGPVARIQGAPLITVGICNVQGQLLDASISRGDGISFSWSPTNYLNNTASSKPIFVPGKTTRYKLMVTDIKGLKDTTSVLVSVIPAPKAVTDKNVFVDSPTATILLNGSKSIGTGITYLWQTKEGIIMNGETQPMAQVSGLGMYYLKVTDQQGCSNRDSVNVGLYIQAINDTAKTIMNQSVTINVLRNDLPKGKINPSSISIVTPPLHGMATVSADSLILYLPDEMYFGEDAFIYAICDYFKNCDQAKVLVIINDIPFFIPEAFSPNGDGINDKFEIKGLTKYKTVEIEIFNRWGNIVYQSKNYGEGEGKSGFWDGNANFRGVGSSGPVTTGTYYYILRLNGKEKINGSIYLDR